MFNIERKYVAFAIGVLLGCVVVGGIFSAKQATRKTREAENPVLQLRPEKALPGQDMHAREPLYAPYAKATYEGPVDSEGQFERILIDQKKEGSPLIRYVENIFVNPQTGRQYLITRQKMYADEVVLRLREDANISAVEALIEPLGYTVKTQRNEHLFVLNTSDASPQGVPEAIAKLHALGGPIEAALPHYLFFHHQPERGP